jgi:Flp pilus assembly protein TadG
MAQHCFHAFRRRFAGDRRGQVSIIVGMAAVALTGTVGVSLDAAAMNRSATQLQDAADASALFAVRSATVKKMSDDQVVKAAAVFLESSYDAEDVSDVSGDKRNDVTTRVLSRSPTTVEVSATRVVELPFGFLRGGDGSMTVTRTSTAVEALSTPITLLLLDRTASSAWRATGTSGLVALEGAAIVNSSSPSALDGSGTADIETTGTLVAGPAFLGHQLDAEALLPRQPDR